MLSKIFQKSKNYLLTDGKKHWPLIVLGIVTGLVLSNLYYQDHSETAKSSAKHQMTGHSTEKKIKHWTCSMHPQIKLPQPGLCPICSMKLIPVYEDSGRSGNHEQVSITMNETARQLAEVETSEVKFTEAANEVRLVGKVNYDETSLSYISAWVAGRIDKLFVDFTGTKVREGDHLIQLYSPELIATQEEYLQAIKNLDETQNSELSVIRNTSRTTLTSAKEKLRLYGINETQIEEIVKRGTPQEHMTITSPVKGTVINKNGFEGMYVQKGEKIYTIADLSKVWLYLDAYESDIQWLHYGQNVSIETESYPGETFHGKIAFIDPFVNDATRTIKLRVNVNNVGEKLKPGMFVRATIKSVIGAEGNIYEEDLAGKWICPMHPDIIKDHEGICDLCEMNLISTSEFGFSDDPAQKKKVLVIPKTAPLITGKRAVVYVENLTDTTGVRRYTGREIVLGPRAGDFYVVRSGLTEGEKVVTNGNFNIDSALQIQGKPSMMNPAGYYSEHDQSMIQIPGSSIDDAALLSPAILYYLEASKALAQNNENLAKKALEDFKSKLSSITIENPSLNKNNGLGLDIRSLSGKLENIESKLPPLRNQFYEISEILKEIFNKYEYRSDSKLYLSFCPMAHENGAYWLADTDKINNPYFGTEMLECGEVKDEYGRKIVESKPLTGHEGHTM